MIYSRQNFASTERRVSHLSTEETPGRKIRELCAISQGVYHPTVVLVASIQKENLELTEVSGRIVSVAATYMANHAQDLPDNSSDTVMDVTDLADLDVYSELTTERSSRLSTVEVFDTAMQLRGLVQSMKSSVPPVPHANDMSMYSHLEHQFKL